MMSIDITSITKQINSAN